MPEVEFQGCARARRGEGEVIMRVWLCGRVDQVQFRNAANLGGEIVGAAGQIGKPEVERVGLPDDRRQVLADRAIRTHGAKARRVLAAVGAAGNEELRAYAELGNIAARCPNLVKSPVSKPPLTTRFVGGGGDEFVGGGGDELGGAGGAGAPGPSFTW